MVVEIVMPKMGDMMTKGKIVKWLKEQGEKVEKGEPILEVETEKTTIEIESRASGILRKILIREGEEVPIATTIGYIAQEGEMLPEEQTRETTPITGKVTRETAVEAQKVQEKPQEAAARIKASPLAKKLAEEKGVDLASITGTGPGGRITKEDVLNYLASGPVAPVGVPIVEKAEAPVSEFQVVPMTSMRRAIARKMVESKVHVPHFYIGIEVDMTEAVKMREDLVKAVEAKTRVRLSFTHLIIKAVAMALEEFPQLNSSLEGENIKIWNDINIGIAVGLEDGLIVPVLRRTNKLSLLEIVSEASRLIAKAREKKLREDEFSGGTFTISNMGTLDVETFFAIINVPEIAILAVGRISDKPAVVNGQITIRKIMSITVSADHRVTDGLTAAKFLQKVKSLLEAPYNLLLPS